MSTAEPPGAPVNCPMCGAVLPSATATCPECGEKTGSRDLPRARSQTGIQLTSEDFGPATGIDWGLAIFTAIASSTLSFPLLVWLFEELQSGRLGEAAIFTAMLNGFLWGIPVLGAIARWREGVMANAGNSSHVIRTFWRFQMMTAGVPFCLLLMLFAVCATS